MTSYSPLTTFIFLFFFFLMLLPMTTHQLIQTVCPSKYHQEHFEVIQLCIFSLVHKCVIHGASSSQRYPGSDEHDVHGHRSSWTKCSFPLACWKGTSSSCLSRVLHRYQCDRHFTSLYSDLFHIFRFSSEDFSTK